MRKLSRILLALVVAASALALVTCAAKPSSIVLMHDKGGNPDYRPFYDQMGQLSKTATGVSFTQSPYPDTTTYQAAVRAALPTDKAPDLFTWWSTYRMKDLVRSEEHTSELQSPLI
jgi:multiple sugar transport system substrate-binding protein